MATIRDVNVTIDHGELICIVGPSGAGKSTFIQVLLGLLHRFDGSVQVNGRDPRWVRTQSGCGWTGLVSQSPHLLHGTVRENVLLGLSDTSDDTLWGALEDAGLSRTIMQLPSGIDTVVGERGFSLSGGEMQRLALARAIVRKPSLLILDEPMTGLDGRTARSVWDSVVKLNRLHTTTIVVTHDIHATRMADRIVVFESGRLVEEGTFDELMALGRLFRTLAVADTHDGNRDPALDAGRLS